jgi:hypothetical protein
MRWLLAGMLAVTLFSPTLTSAISVSGTADIYLAGQPAGTQFLFGNFDSAPAQSPIALTLAGFGGTPLQFVVTGAAGNDTGIPLTGSSSPDGGSPFQPDAATFGPFLGLSAITTTFNSLVGVFLADTAPDPAATPSALSFSSGAEMSFMILAPQLQQVFFIGDGLTGTGSGERQTFMVPTGATRLFLGSADGVGQSANNFGAFDAEVSSVPEPPSMLLFAISGGIALGTAVWRRRRKDRSARLAPCHRR